MTKEIPYYFKMEEMTIEEIINLKNALDNNKKTGGVNFQAHIVMYMQVPQVKVSGTHFYESQKEFSQFFNDIKKLKIDPNKGDWFV